MGEGSMASEEKIKPFCDGYIHVLGLGASAIPVFQGLRSNIEKKNQDRKWINYWRLWSFSLVPSGLELYKWDAQRNFGEEDMLFLLVDTADKASVQNAEQIGQCENPNNIGYPIIFAFLLGDGEQDARERIASAVDCFVDLRNVQLKQNKRQETVKQLVYIFISSILAPFEGDQMVGMGFDDIQKMFSHGDEIHFGVGHAVLERPEDDVCMVVAKEATRELEAQCNLRSIRRAFLSIEQGTLGSLFYLHEAASEIAKSMDENCDFYFNTSVIPNMKEDRVRAVLFATEAPITKRPPLSFEAGRDNL